MDNTYIQEKLLPRLSFNPGLALTGFRTTRPWFKQISYSEDDQSVENVWQ